MCLMLHVVFIPVVFMIVSCHSCSQINLHTVIHISPQPIGEVQQVLGSEQVVHAIVTL